MKYCVSGRQPKSVLQKAEQIKLQYEDRNKIIDLIEDFPQKTFIIEIPQNVVIDEIDWEILSSYAEKVDFILCLNDLSLIKKCYEKNLKYYWAYPVFTWYELQGLINLNPCYISVSTPMSFNLKKIKEKTDIPLRVVPHLAYDMYIPRSQGLYGTWIRPEDTEVYEEYIDVFDFQTFELSKEATLLHIYKDNREWPGNLNLLITNLNINVDNRVIPEEFGKTRANCGQRCMENSSCHFCETAIKYAGSVRNLYYEKLKQEKDKN